MKIIENRLSTPKFIKELVEDRIEREIDILRRVKSGFGRCYVLGTDCECCPYKEYMEQSGKDACIEYLDSCIEGLINTQIDEYKDYLAHIRTL